MSGWIVFNFLINLIFKSIFFQDIKISLQPVHNVHYAMLHVLHAIMLHPV